MQQSLESKEGFIEDCLQRVDDLAARQSLCFVDLMEPEEGPDKSVIFTSNDASEKELMNSDDQTLANSNEQADFDLDKSKSAFSVLKELNELKSSLSPILKEFQGEMAKHASVLKNRPLKTDKDDRRPEIEEKWALCT